MIIKRKYLYSIIKSLILLIFGLLCFLIVNTDVFAAEYLDEITPFGMDVDGVWATADAFTSYGNIWDIRFPYTKTCGGTQCRTQNVPATLYLNGGNTISGKTVAFTLKSVNNPITIQSIGLTNGNHYISCEVYSTYDMPTINLVEEIYGPDYVTTHYPNYEVDNSYAYSVICPTIPTSGVSNFGVKFYFDINTDHNISSLRFGISKFYGYENIGTISQDVNNVSNSVNNVNSSLNDSSGLTNDEVSSDVGNWSSQTASDTPVSDFILMPINLLNKIIQGTGSSCSSFNLGNLMGTDIILPCLNLGNTLGSVWNIIDVILSGIVAYKFAMHVIVIFKKMTSLEDITGDLTGGDK